MAKGILRHTKVKSVPFSIETLSVVIGIFLIKKDNRYLIQRRFCFVTGTVVLTPGEFRCHRNKYKV